MLALVGTSGPTAMDGVGPAPVRGTGSAAAWLAFSGGVFSVDAVDRTVRYRGCDGDTGRVADPRMRVGGGTATGKVTAGGTTYAYRVPLAGRSRGVVEVFRQHRQPDRRVGEVVTNPQPPTDPAAGGRLSPLTGQLARVVAAATDNPAGVAVRDLSGRYGDQQIAVNGGFRPKAVSVIKLWILVEVLRRVDCGQLSLDGGVRVTRDDVVGGTGKLKSEAIPQVLTYHRLAEYMIMYSDNTAANVLIDQFGGTAPVNALIDSMNQRDTVLARKFFDADARGEENYTSPDDVISLLGAVWDARILTESSRDLMIDFMRRQTLNTKIPAALPPGAPLAHKTGDDLRGVSHDVGYCLTPGAETAVAFLTTGPFRSGSETVRQLTRTVHDYVTPGCGRG
ncbi:serine hydrolase [Micromonospora coerulea]